MLFPQRTIPLDDQHWRRINMRKVSHVIGAEMIHNLYDRHWARINSLRFRHTITNVKDGIVESYAPMAEWDYLQHWLSQRFLSLDPILIREIEAIMCPTYALVDEIIDRIDGSDLRKCTNQELALLLIDIVDLPLGDIYKLNVVQIEYSLNFALHKVLQEYEPNAQDRNELLAQLISPGVLTAAQEEEVAFGNVVAWGLNRGIADPSKNSTLLKLIEGHYAQFAPAHCAYGEEPPVLKDYTNKYEFMYKQGKLPPSIEDAEKNVAEQHGRSKRLLAKLNDEKLTILCDLMARIGVFRDQNKAKLGQTILRRLVIMDEIARRTKVRRDDLNYYLMAELTTLVDTNSKLSSKVIQERKQYGISFVRNEDVVAGIQPIALSIRGSQHDSLPGICASPGKVNGVAKIIRTKDDIVKVSPGDIMVAIGTDFDLLEIMNISGGIITEEGGLLSHASVVSRELKKPCLIGVANATKLLNDGDQLSLEATDGRVGIVKRAKIKV
jgi:phosphohistidine swiveling domain-containing protein